MSARLVPCRICDSDAQFILSLGKQPIANRFLDEPGGEEFFAEIGLSYCEACSLAQLVSAIPPGELYTHRYPYRTRTSSGMSDHLEKLAATLAREKILNRRGFVVEIGSNDGTLLQHLKRRTRRHLGVDPCGQAAEICRSRSLRAQPVFFNEHTAEQILDQEGKADAIVSTNSVSHYDDIASVLRGIKRLLAPRGSLILEEPSLRCILERTLLDQIYDEHVYFFSVTSMNQLLSCFGLALYRVQGVPTHGGSLRFYIGHRGAHRIEASVSDNLRAEKDSFTPRSFADFRQNCDALRGNLTTLLHRLKKQKKRIVGYGATAKSTLLFNYCQIGNELVDYICDTTPTKQGKFTPGMHIPVVPLKTYREDRPDYTLLLAWNHAPEILAKEKRAGRAAMKWIFYVPQVSVEAL